MAWIDETKGAVEAERKGAWSPAATGLALHLGDAVRTKAASSARLRFAGGRLLAIGENALVRLGASTEVGQPRVKIDFGEVELEGEGTLLVDTARGVARLDPGTRLRIRATADSARYEVLVGRAVLLDSAGDVVVGTGEGVEILPGGGLTRYQISVGAPIIEPPAAAAPDAAPPGLAPQAAPTEPAEPEPPDREAATARAPTVADVALPGGESAIIHDRHASVAVRVRFDHLCPGGGAVEVASGASFRAPKQRASGNASGIVLLPPGTHRYRVLCGAGSSEPEARAAGRLTLKRDSGTAPLPRTAAVNVIEADGRRYTVLYQTRLPALWFVWPEAPVGVRYRLHVETQDKEQVKAQVFPAATARHRLPSGAMGEGQHRLWFSAPGGKTSPRTDLAIRFDNAAATAQLQSPKDGGRWAGSDVAVAGVALEGSTVSIGGQPLTVDTHGRFRGTAPPPGPGERAIAVRLEHPRSGIHYYIRRVAGVSRQ